MQNIMLMRLQELSKNCASFVRRSGLLFHFILAQSGIILAQFLYKSYTISYYILFYCNGRTALRRGISCLTMPVH